MIKQAILLAVTCSVLSTGASTSVRTDKNVESVRVNYQDININTEAGQVKLYQRITQAAKSVCGSTIRSNTSSLKEVLQNRACVKQATADAMAETGTSYAVR